MIPIPLNNILENDEISQDVFLCIDIVMHVHADNIYFKYRYLLTIWIYNIQYEGRYKLIIYTVCFGKRGISLMRNNLKRRLLGFMMDSEKTGMQITEKAETLRSKEDLGDVTDSFRDDNFRTAVRETLGIKEDGPILRGDCARVTFLDVFGRDIRDLAGIENFTALKYLDCSENQLTRLELDGCVRLKGLICSNNRLTVLRVRGCVDLNDDFWFYNNPLQTLDVGGCTSLENLNLNECQLKTLKVDGCTSLEILCCSGTQLTSLDLSGCGNLEQLHCHRNQLESLDVRDCIHLKDLSCEENKLTSLDVGEHKDLRWLMCKKNQLTTLNVKNCASLKWLECCQNRLRALDVGGCEKLETLNCFYNDMDGPKCIRSRDGIKIRFSPQNHTALSEILDSGICPDGLTWKVTADRTLTISGTGTMMDYDRTGAGTATTTAAPWEDYLVWFVDRIVLEEGVTGIGSYAFYHRLDNIIWDEAWLYHFVTLPESLARIGDYAFAGCDVAEIFLPPRVEYIGSCAFSGSYGKITVSNPACKIQDDGCTLNASLICGHRGSTAQQYAEKYKKRFLDKLSDMK